MPLVRESPALSFTVHRRATSIIWSEEQRQNNQREWTEALQEGEEYGEKKDRDEQHEPEVQEESHHASSISDVEEEEGEAKSKTPPLHAAQDDMDSDSSSLSAVNEETRKNREEQEDTDERAEQPEQEQEEREAVAVRRSSRRPKLIKTPSRATFLLFDAVMSRKRKRNEDDEEEKETEESEIEEAKGQGCICPVCHRKEKRMKSNNPNSRWVKCDICQKWYHGKCVGITKETWEEWDELGDAAPDWYCGCAEHPAPSIAPAAALPPPDIAAPPSPSVLAPPLAPAPLPVASSIQQEDEDTGERPEKNRKIIMDIDEN